MTRAELFEKVWNKPTMHVAAELGMSGPGLKKTCDRYDIQAPSRGDRARLRAGQKIEPPMLRGDPNQVVRARFRPPETTRVTEGKVASNTAPDKPTIGRRTRKECTALTSEKPGHTADPFDDSAQRTQERQEWSTSATDPGSSQLCRMAAAYPELECVLRLIDDVEQRISGLDDDSTARVVKEWVRLARREASLLNPALGVIETCRKAARGSTYATWWRSAK
jgi:hypothetical protein